TTLGAAAAAAPVKAAPARNLRRLVDLDVRDGSVVMCRALLGVGVFAGDVLGPPDLLTTGTGCLFRLKQVVRGGPAQHKAETAGCAIPKPPPPPPPSPRAGPHLPAIVLTSHEKRDVSDRGEHRAFRRPPSSGRSSIFSAAYAASAPPADRSRQPVSRL